MRIIERYINGSIIKLFFGTVFIFSFLYILIDATMNLDEYIDRKVPLMIIARYYLSFLPIILVRTSSIACLISVLLTFSALNNSNEAIVLRSSGLNFWQITKPAIAFSVIIAAFVFFLNERYVPQATQMTQQIENESLSLAADQYRNNQAIKNLTFYGLNNRLYFIDTYYPKSKELNGITIIEYDNEQNTQQKIVAFEGKWTGIAWKFYQCQITTYENSGNNAPVKVKAYDEKLMDIKESPEDFMKQRLNVDAMNIVQLKSYINRFSNSGATKALNNLRVDVHHKAAIPFRNIVIVLLGLPFAMLVKSRKGTTFTSIGVAVGIAFLYYVMEAVFLAFGKGSFIPPFLAAWSPPLFSTGIALLVIENKF